MSKQLSTDIPSKIAQTVQQTKLDCDERGALETIISGGVCKIMLNREHTILYANEGFYRMIGCPPEARERLKGLIDLESIVPCDPQAVREAVVTQLDQQDIIAAELEFFAKGGGKRFFNLRAKRLADVEGCPVLLCVLNDDTKLKRLHEECAFEKERYRIVAEQTNNIIFEYSYLDDTMFCSAKWEDLFGYQLPAYNVAEIFLKSNIIHRDDDAKFKAAIAQAADGVENSHCEIRLLKSDGAYLWVFVSLTILFGEKGTLQKIVGRVANIDEQKKERQALLDRAQRDSLTHLYNTNSTQTLVGEALTQGDKDTKGAFLMIDVDNFKTINDTLGHLFGDAVLKECSSKIQKLVRSSDIVGRIGGDEFVVFLRDIKDHSTAVEKARAICAIFSEEKHVTKQSFTATCSVGIAIFPDDGKTYQQLYQNADTALYAAKSRGKNCLELFSDNAGFHCHALRFEELVKKSTNKLLPQKADIKSSLLISVFNMLFGAKDIIKAVEAAIRLVGIQFDLGRIYIYERLTEENLLVSTYEWCNENIPRFTDVQTEISGDYYDRCAATFENEGIFYCSDFEMLEKESEVYRFFSAHTVCSVLQCSIADKGAFKGVIGFEDCNSARLWRKEEIEMLGVISNMIASFVVRFRTDCTL